MPSAINRENDPRAKPARLFRPRPRAAKPIAGTANSAARTAGPNSFPLQARPNAENDAYTPLASTPAEIATPAAAAPAMQYAATRRTDSVDESPSAPPPARPPGTQGMSGCPESARSTLSA